MPANALSVSSLGYLAASRLANAPEGRQVIHSRFQHTLNLRLADGMLLPLVSAHHSLNHPDALRVNVVGDHDWRATPWVNWQQGVLSAPGWQLAPAAAALWQPASISPITFEALDLLTSLLKEWCLAHQVVSALQLYPDAPSGRQVAISIHDSTSALGDMADRIVGFGSGLTPDGDDYLVGYLAALAGASHSQIIEHQQRLAAVIWPRLPRTNDISRHYLQRALEGHFSEALCCLRAVLTTAGDIHAVRQAAEQVMAFGAASGADCMAGFLHGLRHLNALPVRSSYLPRAAAPLLTGGTHECSTSDF